MILKVIDTSSVTKFINRRYNQGLVVSALNLFMLGFVKYNSELTRNTYFWCDGLMGVIYLRLKGKKVNQLRGVEMLKLILNTHAGESINVLGTCSENSMNKLKEFDIHVANKYSLDDINIDSFIFDKIVLTSNIVIITLPSPKQEIVAFNLSSNQANKNVHFYCIGGALNMLSNPEIDCPRYLQKTGLEFLFRLKTDTKRRMLRLLKSLYLTIFNSRYLSRIKIKVYHN